MAYRFNSGIGGVTCDKCNILFDEDLGYKDYQAMYGKEPGGKDICWRCKAGIPKRKRPNRVK